MENKTKKVLKAVMFISTLTGFIVIIRKRGLLSVDEKK